jgi:hypothetical protein
MERRSVREQRPGLDGVSNASFPAEWGRPPVGRKLLRRWIISRIRDGEFRQMRGERVEWLAPREQR